MSSKRAHDYKSFTGKLRGAARRVGGTRSLPVLHSALTSPSPIFWLLLFLRNCICFASVAEGSPATPNNSFSSETAASPFYAAQHRPAERFPARPSVSGRAGSPTVNRSPREYTRAQSDQVYCRLPVAFNESLTDEGTGRKLSFAHEYTLRFRDSQNLWNDQVPFS